MIAQSQTSWCRDRTVGTLAALDLYRGLVFTMFTSSSVLVVAAAASAIAGRAYVVWHTMGVLFSAEFVDDHGNLHWDPCPVL